MRVIHAEHAEVAVLGSLLLAPEYLDEASAKLSAEDFYDSRNQEVYRALMALHRRSSGVDTVVLRDQLVSTKSLEAAGGDERLLDLTTRIPTTALMGDYIETVRQKAAMRRLVQECQLIQAEAETCEDPRALIESAERRILSAVDGGTAQRPTRTLAELASEHLRSIVRSQEDRRSVGVPTGIDLLDQYIVGGFKAGNLVVVAGTPGSGKTALALQFAEQVPRLDRHVVVFSLEMTADEVFGRYTTGRSGVNGDKLHQASALRDETRRYFAGVEHYASVDHIHVCDQERMSIPAMRAEVRRVKSKHQLGMIVVDYLQLARTGERGLPRFEEVSEVSRSLKAMAKEFRVPVVALSQLSRALQKREDKRPQMSDLRESGQIEQDADVILMLYRDELHNTNSTALGKAELNLVKQRNGETGRLPLSFDGPRMRFGKLRGHEAR